MLFVLVYMYIVQLHPNFTAHRSMNFKEDDASFSDSFMFNFVYRIIMLLKWYRISL